MLLRDGEIFNDCVFAFTPSGGAEVDLTTYVQEIEFSFSRDEKDNTRMGHTSKSRKKGLGEWSFKVTLLQQFGASQGGVDINLALWTELNANTIGAVRFRPFNAAKAAGNPEFTGPATLFNHTPAKGKVGDLLLTMPEFKSAGNLAMATS